MCGKIPYLNTTIRGRHWGDRHRTTISAKTLLALLASRLAAFAGKSGERPVLSPRASVTFLRTVAGWSFSEQENGHGEKAARFKNRILRSVDYVAVGAVANVAGTRRGRTIVQPRVLSDLVGTRWVPCQFPQHSRWLRLGTSSATMM